MSDYGKLSIVGTPIGNLSDFSPRGIETLESADYIAAEDTRVSLRLLTHFGIKKPMLSYYKPHEAEKSARILELLSDGQNVALVSDAGMPCISDPGVYLVQKCYEMCIPVEVIPGCNAAVAAVAVSGIDTQRFAFEGFLPVNKKERAERLVQIASMPHTLIFYEAPHKLKQTLSDLNDKLGGERQCALCRELTKLHEEVIRGTLGELAHYYDEAEPRGDYVVVVEGSKGATDEGMTIGQAAELARQLVAGGEKLTEACRQAAQASGVSKRELYRMLIDEKNNGE